MNRLAVASSNGHATRRTDEALPRNLEAEQSLLGSILLAPSVLDDLIEGVGAKAKRTRLVDAVRPEHFMEDDHGTIYTHLTSMRREGEAIDHVTVIDRLKAAGAYDRIGGAHRIAEIAQSVPHAANAGHYAKIVLRYYHRRRRELLIDELSRSRDIDEFLADLDELRREDGQQSAIEPVSITRLVADHPRLHEPVIQGLLRTGETANIIAPPKMRKSWLVYSLALSVASGASWLDRFPCRAGRVLLIDLELHPETIASRIPAVADALELRSDDYADRLDVLSLRGRLLDIHGIARLLDRYSPGEYALIVLDAQYRAMPATASENEQGQMTAIYNTIDATTARLGAAWVTIHHTSKGNQAAKSVTDMGSGAGSMSRAVDAHIVMREHEDADAVVMEAALRSFAPMEPLALRWTFPVWRVDGHLDTELVKGKRTRGESRQAAKDSAGHEEILAALLEYGSKTETKLLAKVAMSGDRLRRLLTQMREAGTIDWRNGIASGNACTEYKHPERGWSGETDHLSDHPDHVRCEGG